MDATDDEGDDGISAENIAEGTCESRRPSVFHTCWDSVDLVAELHYNVPTLEYIPSSIRGPFLQAYTLTLTRLEQAYARPRPSEIEITRGWKELILLPRMVLHPVGASGNAGKVELRKRIKWLRAGQYNDLLMQARGNARGRSARTETSTSQVSEQELKWKQADKLIQKGLLSRAAKILCSLGLAPRDSNTLAQLTDPAKRPPHLIEPLPSNVLNYRLNGTVPLDTSLFLRNLRRARKGGTPGRSGTRNEHLKPLLENPAATNALQEIAIQLASANVPPEIRDAICLCSLTALQKGAAGVSNAHGPSARVRGLAVGEVLRRLVSRTLAQQYQDEFEAATAPQ